METVLFRSEVRPRRAVLPGCSLLADTVADRASHSQQFHVEHITALGWRAAVTSAIVGFDCAREIHGLVITPTLLLGRACSMSPRVPWVDRRVVVSHALYQRTHCLLPFTKIF